MADTLSLGDRMKGYEGVSKSSLMKRAPVIIRLDGKAFHTYTKGFDKPFDSDLHFIREQTLNHLCNSIQGALFGYAQSDELSIVVKDWQTLNSQSWFGNNLQKICSISASMCTGYFNNLSARVSDGVTTKFNNKVALFDSRVFNLPREEVINYLIWRQQDWERNSVQMMAQSIWSHKELQGKSCKTLITKLEEEKGIVYGDLPNWQKRGEFWAKDVGINDCPIFKDWRGVGEYLLNYTEEL